MPFVGSPYGHRLYNSLLLALLYFYRLNSEHRYKQNLLHILSGESSTTAMKDSTGTDQF